MGSLWMALVMPAPAAQDGYAQLQAFADGLESLAAEFEQITIDADGQVIESSRGRMLWQAPDRARWEYYEPFEQIIVADGDHLWHYDKALEQVTVRPQPAAEQSPMFALMRPELVERFYRVLPSDRPDQLRFEPLAEPSEIRLIRLTLRDGVPWTLDLFDTFGQSTRIVLEAIERNPGLDAGLFRFDPPEGVDVLEGY